MRVLFLIRSLAGIGGAERAVLELAAAMVARGHSATVATHDRASDASFYPVPEGVDLVRLASARPEATARHENAPPSPETEPRKKKKHRPVRNWLKRWQLHSRLLRTMFWLPKNARIVRRIRACLQREQPDIVVAFMPNIAVHTAKALRGFSIPSVFATRITPEFDLIEPEGDVAGAVKARMARESLDRFDGLTVLVPDYADLLPAHLAPRIEAIPNDVPTDRFADLRSVPLAERDKAIVFVGRLVDYKRPELLVKAFVRIAAEFPDWVVKFWGEGPQAALLAKLAAEAGLSDRIRLMGITKTIEEAYRGGQIFCLPSLYEGFPRAFSEAMASGLPGVGLDDGIGVRYLLRNGGGNLVPAEQGAEGLSKALARMMRDEAFRSETGAAAALAMEEYRPSKIFYRWETYLTRLAAGSASCQDRAAR